VKDIGFGISEFISLIVTVLITLAGLLQGIDSALNLLGRWRNRASAKVSSTSNNTSRKKIKTSKHQFRWTKRKVNTIFWWLFISLEVWPLYVFFSAFRTWDALSVWVSYVVILFSFPLWLYRSKQDASKRFLKFSIYFIALEMILANAFVLDLFQAPNGEWNSTAMILHRIY